VLSVTTVLPSTGSAPGVRRFPWAGLFVLAIAVFLSVSVEMIPTGLLPEMSAGLGVTESQTGFLVSFFAFSVVLTSVPLTFMTRRVSRHTLVVVVLVVIGITAVLASVAPGYEFLAIVRVIGGMAHGLFWSVVGAYSAHLVPKEQIGRAVAIATGGGTLAFVLGVPLGTAVGHAFGWRVPFLAIGVLTLAGAVLIWFLLPRVRHLVEAEAGPAAPHSGRRRDATIPAVALLCILVAVLMTGHYVFYTYIAPFLIQSVGVPEGQIGSLLFFYGIAGAIGLFLSGSVFGKRPVRGIAMGLVVTAVAVVVLAVFAGLPVVAITAFVVWGVMFGMLPPLQGTRLMHIASPAIRDPASAFYSTAFNVGIGTGALVGGVVLDSAGLGALPWSFLVGILAAAVLLAAGPATAALRRARATA
jgi:predicted MFS family arabinose efflux permease